MSLCGDGRQIEREDQATERWNMEQISTTVLALGERVDKGILSARTRIADRVQADPAWSQYNELEIGRRLAEKKARLVEQVFDELTSLQSSVRTTLDNKRARIRKALYPLASSPLDQAAGIYLEQKAERIIRSVGIAGLQSEYDTAMESGHVDLASGLIDWSERLFGLKETERKLGVLPAGPRKDELDTLARIREEHIDSLRIRDAVTDADYLQSKLAELTTRIQLVKDGRGHYYTLEQIKLMSEAEVSANLSIVNASLEVAGFSK